MPHTPAADPALGRSAAGLFGEPICAKEIRTNPTNVLDRVKARLAASHAALVKHFPTDDPHLYVDFLAQLGEPLDNYGAGSDSAAYRLHPKINVVRCRPGGARVQEAGGPLTAHSGRAFAKQRPAYTAMLMARAGWPGAPGRAGESTAVRWADAVARHRELFPATAERDLALLIDTPIRITAKYVDSELSDLPLLYPLPDSTGPDDLGARFSLVIRDQLPGMGLGAQLTTDYLAALERFAQAANDPAIRYLHLLQQGQLLILDNNRFGHGRLPLPATGPDGTNPRELWSATVA
ncbi:TauD/TfdA family dioxygenase [Streptomyces sp. NRRL B-24484]|uniref:TauD/TfdA family dioxygenase n=1 Tax=Streptomyces sp. NRRL B-24484 TaxID=1463833 RepID=UPI0004C05C38|nr:TauD/TfdA family dioxygenase [Streptomyces sp. NRRL B-24484]